MAMVRGKVEPKDPLSIWIRSQNRMVDWLKKLGKRLSFVG
jgi:hypothetical protein